MIEIPSRDFLAHQRNTHVFTPFVNVPVVDERINRLTLKDRLRALLHV